MANTKSAEKKARQALKHRERNRGHVSKMRTAVKRLRAAVTSGDKAQAAGMLKETLAVVDSTAGKGVVHRNAAARTKSRLTKAVASLSK
jgi:small subunit ribosomal protein S20